MNDRQKQLLNTIVTEYIKTVQPVGSKAIAQGSSFNLSPATIRNEMATLESEGYITHPHTSAGRIPTEKGYQFYTANFLKDSGISQRQEQLLTKVVRPFQKYQPELLKELAKEMANLANSAVFVGFSSTNTYYTGLSNLLAQPEFNQHELVANLGRIIDHFDQVLNKVFNCLNQEVEILIGRKNPFGQDCSTVIARYNHKNHQGVVGILGPLRMDYQNNVNLIRYSVKLVNSKK